jgi:hypothetical protein
MPEKEDISSINLLLNLFLKVDKTHLDILNVAKSNNASPNAYLAAQMATIGNNNLLQKSKEQIKFIIDLIREFGINSTTKKFPKEVDDYVKTNLLTKGKVSSDENAILLYKEIKKSKKDCLSVRVSQYIIDLAEKEKLNIKNEYEFLLATIAICIFWKPMLAKRISRKVVEDSISYFYNISKLFAYSVIDQNNKHWKLLVNEKVSNLNGSFTENAFKILFNRKPNAEELFEFQTLIGLTLTNGPGTISAKGAKESVSARNNISMAFVGFLANTGFAHGGNGFEAIEYLLNIFADKKIDDPGQKSATIDLKVIASKAAKDYAQLKNDAKEIGKLNYDRIPCVNHPVFKGNAVNIDPREQYVSDTLANKKSYNLFLDFYHLLVKELFNEGATNNVFCVNVDAVLAVLTLKLVWQDFVGKKLSKQQIQDIVFTLFLYGRSIGVSAEISDHLDRGQDMDCRTPQSELTFVL